jgi:hypothetical protein
MGNIGAWAIYAFELAEFTLVLFLVLLVVRWVAVGIKPNAKLLVGSSLNRRHQSSSVFLCWLNLG